MFFWLSKILWFVVEPMNLVFMGVVLLALLVWLRWHRAARLLAALMAVSAIVVTTVPMGAPVIQALENRFPQNPALTKVDGIVVLGGIINPALSAARGSVQLGGGTERLTAAAVLAGRFPDARMVFSGGSGDPFRQEFKEAHYAPEVFAVMGLPAERVVFESQSRNTAENAALSRALMKPKPGETWVLITSAFHMPRATGVFRRAGWPVVPYPVDYMTPGDQPLALTFNFANGVSYLSAALHECLGLLFYWLTDRTDELYPGPGQ